MSRDKVTVDEPLISTDVDSLIRTIAEKKRIALSDLRQVSKIDKKTMDKWIAVLEDEGYITVEYGLRGTFVNWRDIDEVPREDKTYRTEGSKDSQIHPEATETVFSEVEHKAPVDSKINKTTQDDSITPVTEEVNEEFTAEVPMSDEPEPEELLSQYIAKKKGGTSDDENIKSNILTRLKSREETATFSGDAPSDESEDNTEAELDAKTEVVHEIKNDDESEMTEEVSEPAEEKVPVYSRDTLRSSQKAPSSDVRELMNSYVAEINKEKAKIEGLKKDRESLYREKFATMEGKMQADIVVLTEKILEKQTKVAELKEHVLELPDKVEELSKLQEQMEVLRKESHEALQRTKNKADLFIQNIEKSKNDVHGKIADVDNLIESQSGQIRELEKLSSAVDTRSDSIKNALESARSEIDELSSTMSSLSTELHQIEQNKEQIRGMTESIKQTVSSHGEELNSLEKELEGISRVEHWVQEYVRDYEQKIDDIEQYVGKSDEELAELKEEAESLYMKKYLGELENITDAYESELNNAADREVNIEQKIGESKDRITDLVKESQEMIRKLKGDMAENPAKDYGIMVAKVKAKTSRAKNVLEEKQQERAKLVEDTKKINKTPKAAPIKVPSKPTPVSAKQAPVSVKHFAKKAPSKPMISPKKKRK